MPILQREQKLEPGSTFIGGRIDRCVQQIAGGSRSHVTGLFDHDCVSLNGTVEINPGKTLREGDLVSVRFEANRRYSPRRRPEEHKHRGFTILFEDADVIVVDKSAELLTVPTDAKEPHTLVYRVNEHVRRTTRGSSALVVHRLDRGVSGLLVFAKNEDASESLQAQFAAHKPDRRYQAFVAGRVTPSKGTYRSYLTTGKNLSRYSTRDEENGELAVTHFQVLATSKGSDRCGAVSHVEVELETGRRNQIRVHFAEAGHPVIGDQRYRTELWKDIPWPFKRLALHAATLSFEHPRSGIPHRFESPLPKELVQLARFAGLQK